MEYTISIFHINVIKYPHMKVDFLSTYIVSEMLTNLLIHPQLIGTLNSLGFSCTNLLCYQVVKVI